MGVLRRGDNGRLPVHQDLPALGLEQAVGHAKDGAFTTAAYTQNAVEGPRLHLKGQSVNDIEVLGGILIGHLTEFQRAHCSSLHDISQKPSSYRLQATKMSSSRRYSSSLQF